MSEHVPAVLELRQINKQFPGVIALRDVNLVLQHGEIHGLVGENGAGKSTLAKIVAGVYPPTSGELIFQGKPHQFNSPHEAQQAGISILFQELNVLPQLSVAENIFLGSELRQRLLPVIDWRKTHETARELMARVGLTCSPATQLGSLSVVKQQAVQLIKALYHKAQLIIMDEPTTRLSEFETHDLFEIMHKLKQDGVTIVFISHRLEEITQICDRVTVLRHGQVVDTVDTDQTSLDSMTTAMLGRRLAERFPRRTAARGPELLRVQGLTRYGVYEDIDFVLHEGEIFGITGLVGAGCTAILKAIFGLQQADEGQVFINRHLAQIQSPRDAIAHGIGLLTEDRQSEGIVLDMGVGENITLASLADEPPGPLIDHSQEAQITDYFIKRLRINTPHPAFKTRHLSGGTQQKVILSKWMATGPHVLLCDEPTQGVDVGAKAEIYRLMNELTETGIGIVIASAEMSEILGLCDRYLVLHAGRMACTFSRDEADEATVLRCAMGRLPP
ncbi:MAG: sugar ABC transporter ATP-binding protein [Chloroflexi bacterium]|nr:sugar ABC transporter ATP-binding protein [Chloroflexota bacterium]